MRADVVIRIADQCIRATTNCSSLTHKFHSSARHRGAGNPVAADTADTADVLPQTNPSDAITYDAKLSTLARADTDILEFLFQYVGWNVLENKSTIRVRVKHIQCVPMNGAVHNA